MCSFCVHRTGREHLSCATRLARICDPYILLEGLTDLLERPWIRRVWILQEIYSAQSVVVQSGPSQVAWNVFERLSHCRTWVAAEMKNGSNLSKEFIVADELTYGKNDAVYDESLIEAHQCMDVLAALTGSPRLSSGHSDMVSDLRLGSKLKNLLYLLKKTYMFRATDQRDKVYALLGIAGILVVSPRTRRTEGSSDFVIEYRPSMTEERLHRRLLEAFASEVQDLTFLDHWTHPGGLNTCPTWQPIELPCANIFKQLSCVIDQWAPRGGYPLKSELQRSSDDTDKSFLRRGRLVLYGKKLETISTISHTEYFTVDGTTDCAELCHVGKTERISTHAEIDGVLNEMRNSNGMCEALRQILREPWWSWEFSASAHPGDILGFCKGVRSPKILRKGPEEEFKFVGSAKMLVKHPSLDLITEQRFGQGVQDFWSEWLAGYKDNLSKFVLR